MELFLILESIHGKTRENRMANAFRLKSTTMFSRMDDDINEQPMRIVFLSVEGNKTERQYYEYV